MDSSCSRNWMKTGQRNDTPHCRCKSTLGNGRISEMIAAGMDFEIFRAPRNRNENVFNITKCPFFQLHLASVVLFISFSVTDNRRHDPHTRDYHTRFPTTNIPCPKSPKTPRRDCPHPYTLCSSVEKRGTFLAPDIFVPENCLQP
jgi:hypothetical protein